MTPPEQENSRVPHSLARPQSASTAAPEPGKGASPEEIEDDLARTRRELGDTVEALTEKLDVKSQARKQIDVSKHRVAEQANNAREHAARYSSLVKARLTDEHGRPTMNTWIGAGALVATTALVLVLVGRARR